jgi:hypothetical protein
VHFAHFVCGRMTNEKTSSFQSSISQLKLRVTSWTLHFSSRQPGFISNIQMSVYVDKIIVIAIPKPVPFALEGRFMEKTRQKDFTWKWIQVLMAKK